MCGSKPKKAKPSAHEIALAEQAGIKDQEFEQDFLPLEVFEIEQFNDPAVQKINRDIISGRQNADIAMAEADALQSIRAEAAATNTGLSSGRNITSISETATDVGTGLRAASVASDQAARDIRDQEGLAIVGTGQGISRGSIESLGSLARQDAYKSSSKLRGKTAEREATINALAATGGAAGFRAKRYYDGVKADEMSQANELHNKGLRVMGSGV